MTTKIKQIEKVEVKESLGLVTVCHYGDWIDIGHSLDMSLKDLDKYLSSAYLTCHPSRVVEVLRQYAKVCVLEISETMLLLDYIEFDGRRMAILLEVMTIHDWFSLSPDASGYYIFDDSEIMEIKHDY